jgi:hypothetical protein
VADKGPSCPTTAVSVAPVIFAINIGISPNKRGTRHDDDMNDEAPESLSWQWHLSHRIHSHPSDIPLIYSKDIHDMVKSRHVHGPP